MIVVDVVQVNWESSDCLSNTCIPGAVIDCAAEITCAASLLVLQQSAFCRDIDAQRDDSTYLGGYGSDLVCFLNMGASSRT
jgi:hypothetical protein